MLSDNLLRLKSTNHQRQCLRVFPDQKQPLIKSKYSIQIGQYHEVFKSMSQAKSFLFLWLFLFQSLSFSKGLFRFPIVRVINQINKLHWEVPRLKLLLPKTTRAQVAQITEHTWKSEIILFWHRWCTLNRDGCLRLGIPKEDLPLPWSAAKHWSLFNVSDLLYFFYSFWGVCGHCEFAATWHHTTDNILHSHRLTAPSLI